jgi:hypothetical protein
MPCDVALHAVGNLNNGQQRPALHMPPLQSIVSLAEAADSTDIIVPATGGVLVLQGTIKLRAAVLKSNEDGTTFTGSPDPATSGVVLQPDIPRTFSLARGRYRVRTSVYA